MTRVRFAPSPTGKLHLGSARTAIFNWLYAQHTGGKFILRIEDTDLNRSDEAYIDSIINDMKWLGMDYDEFYKQSERFDIYREWRDKLIANGKAYYCTCSKDDLIERNKARGIADELTKYDRHCRGNSEKPDGKFVVRLDMGEDRDIIFKDLVRKSIRVNTKELDDFVLWKSDDSPTYNFAVVIDDALMKISHIMRGEDHITNTAKQLVLYDYLGFETPIWGHLPLVFGKDKSPLSKRKGSTNIDDYRKKGILPNAILNYIARLGWSHGNDEIFTLEQLKEYFTVDKLNKSNAVYDEEKMRWVNGKHLKIADLTKLLQNFDEFLAEAKLEKIGKMDDNKWLTLAIDALRSRNYSLLELYDEMKAYASTEYTIENEADKKLKTILATNGAETAFDKARSIITDAGDFNLLADDAIGNIEQQLRDTAKDTGIKFGALVQILRIKLTGKLVSPDIISVIKLLGDEVEKRLV